MSRPPLAREKVLDAFEQVVLEDGERAATLDRVAAAAGVSKGGLLYHFASKAALEEGLVQRLIELMESDLQELAQAPEGMVSAFIRTSTYSDDKLDRAIAAVGRLATNGSAIATEAIAHMRTVWRQSLKAHVESEVGLDLIMLVSDGIYFNNSMTIGGTVPELTSMDEIIRLVIKASGAHSPTAN